MYHQHCLSILLAGKSSENHQKGSKLVEAKNRGGLWIVSNPVIQICQHIEAKFRSVVKKFYNKIDSQTLIDDLMKNCGILSNFDKIRNESEEKVSKEIALNLLEQIITLFVRARTFSYVRNQQQLHKIGAKKKKSRSLRTEIKKVSASLDQGH